MNDSNDILKDLCAPFREDQIRYRVGATTNDKKKGLALAYIDQRDCQDRLDDACGPAGWQTTHSDAGDGRLCCSIGILIGDVWVWKSDGAGGRESSKGLSNHDANKGDFSDSFKRAATAWGVGRYLYDFKNQWVEINQYKQIADGMRPILDKAHAMLAGNVSNRLSKAQSRSISNMIASSLDDIETVEECVSFYNDNKDEIKTLHPDFQQNLITKFAVRKSKILDKQAKERAA